MVQTCSVDTLTPVSIDIINVTFAPQSLDGFLLVILSDGTIVYLSESIHKHMGLFQSEHIGYSIYNLILEEDHAEVKTTIAKAEVTALSRLSSKGTT